MMQTKQASIHSKLWFYVLLWLFFAYLYVEMLSFGQESANLIIGGMYIIEFGVHEASHIVSAFLPPVLCAAAGSVGEVGFTFLMAYAALRAKSYFAFSFTLLWVMLAMNSMGNYMADARAQKIQLVGPGPDPQHDWHFVFDRLGWLDWDTLIGGAVKASGDIIGLIGLGIGLFLIYRLSRIQSKK